MVLQVVRLGLRLRVAVLRLDALLDNVCCELHLRSFFVDFVHEGAGVLVAEDELVSGRLLLQW